MAQVTSFRSIANKAAALFLVSTNSGVLVFSLWSASTTCYQILRGSRITTGKFLTMTIDQSQKYHSAPVPYSAMHHSEQECAHHCSDWCIVGCGTNVLWDLWDWSIEGATYISSSITEPFSCTHPSYNATCISVVTMHYSDVIMGTIASQITSLTIVNSNVYSDADQRKH